jgi:hypothetical protein
MALRSKTFTGLPPAGTTAALDEAHFGRIRGALGTIQHGDYGPRRTLWARGKTLLPICRSAVAPCSRSRKQADKACRFARPDGEQHVALPNPTIDAKSQF